MRVDVFTIFPDLISDYCSYSLLSNAISEKRLALNLHNLREFGLGKHRKVDDEPYGGGAGMIMRCEPIFDAVESVSDLKRPLYVLSPKGKIFDQQMANDLSKSDGFSLICSRYEGIDERVVSNLAEGEISIGDYVLAGGELAALVVIEAVARLLPGFMGNSVSPVEETFFNGLLEAPQYTRPSEFKGLKVPEVLMNGDHEKIRKFSLATSLYETLKKRPDLIEKRGGLTEDEQKLLDELKSEF